MLHEVLEGRGQLEKWENPDKRYEVTYRFDIHSEIVERPGLPRVTSKRHSQGVIISATGERFPEGYYRLHASDGEVLKVQNVNLGIWVILAS
jgi:hypothetical protein